jgi:hypothetical protein
MAHLPRRQPKTLCLSAPMFLAIAGAFAGCSSPSSEKVDAGHRKYCDAYCVDGSTDLAGGEARTADLAVPDLPAPPVDGGQDSAGPDTRAIVVDVSDDSPLIDVANNPLDSGAERAATTAEISGSGGAGGSTGAGGAGGSTGAGGATTDVRPDSLPDATDAKADVQSNATDVQPDATVQLDTTVRLDSAVQLDATVQSDTTDVRVSLDLSVGIDLPVGIDSPNQPDANTSCVGAGARFAEKWGDPATDPVVVMGLASGVDGTLWSAGKFYCGTANGAQFGPPVCVPFDFGSGGITPSGSDADAFITKLDPATGVAQAAFSYKDLHNNDQEFTKVAVSASGTVGVIGDFVTEIDFTSKYKGHKTAGKVDVVSGYDYLFSATEGATNFYAVFDSTGGAPAGTPTTPSSSTVDVGSGALKGLASHPSQDGFVICGKTSVLSDIVTNAADVAGTGMDIVVAKINGQGTVLWGRQFGGAGDQICQSVALDNNGDVIIAGNYNGTLAFDAVNLPTINDIGVALLYLAKLAGADGTTISAKTWGTAGRNIPYGLTVDKDNNVIVAGMLGGNIDFGGGIAMTFLGFTDAYVAKLSSSLVPLWAKSFGDAQFDQLALSVATSANGDVYLTGSFVGSMGAMNLTSFGNVNTDVFVAQLAAADGSVLCAHAYGDSVGAQLPVGITVARSAAGSSADSVTVAGTFASNMTFGSTTLSVSSGPAGSQSSFVAGLSQ